MNIKGVLIAGRIGWRVLRAIVERRRARIQDRAETRRILDEWETERLNERLREIIEEGGA